MEEVVLHLKVEEMSILRGDVVVWEIAAVVPCWIDEHVLSGKSLHLTWPRDWIVICYASACLLGSDDVLELEIGWPFWIQGQRRLDVMMSCSSVIDCWLCFQDPWVSYHCDSFFSNASWDSSSGLFRKCVSVWRWRVVSCVVKRMAVGLLWRL